MEKYNEEFRKIILNITCYDEFDDSLKKMNSTKKGIYFEIFCKLYFMLTESYKSRYLEIYLYSEIPEKIKNKLNLPDKDKGIDGITIMDKEKYYVLQVKYRKNKKTIPFGKLATFPALAFGTNCKNIEGGIFFTNCYDVCDEIKCDKYNHITYSCFDKCNNEFWNNCRKILVNKEIIHKIYEPYPFQEQILEIAKKYYSENEYGRLYLPCGCGKTLMSLFISINILKLSKIFIIVPSLYLLSETYEVWTSQLYKNNFKFLLIGSDIDKKDNYLCEYILTTNEKNIELFLNIHKKNIVVISTYQSSELLKNSCEKTNFVFDIGIYDEAHRTVGTSEKQFTILLKNKKISKKRLFMTATEKIYCYKKSTLTNEQQEEVFSMDDELIYGKVIYNYSTRQAIEEKHLVDYKIIAPFISSDNFDVMLRHNEYLNINNSAIEIKMIAFALMIVNLFKSEKIRHLLIFSNKNKRAKKILEIIEKIFKKEEIEIFTKYLNGNDTMNKRKYQVKLFEQSEKGIISSVKIFGEGVNIPMCDSVCFIDNKESAIDITQYIGRSLRKCDAKPNKIAHIIIPFVLENENNFFDNSNKSFCKIRKILKSIGTTDEIICENFILKNYNKKLFKKKDLKEYLCEMIIGKKINIDEFKKNIISKIFNKDGEIENIIRNKIIYENKKRMIKGKELIDSKKKCLEFLKSKNENVIPYTNNWIKYCLGNNLFLEMKNKYYYSKEELKKVFEKLKMKNFEEYKIKYVKDEKLPPPIYINDGFYYDLDNKLDISSLMPNINYSEY